ncbi:glycosyltransferase [Marinobacter nauticus]|uniref:glycosyltransferase n=1 Tax=Marinobacter nauticus TaxID=2743 RepID=UPI001C9A10DD|nr:glycosyltransferase [Marinobacter nauticus]MBY5961346.1 glycosyltransferase [Marinobacter nauticus]
MSEIKKTVLINASNLHNGGGVQVATSFVSEILSTNVMEMDVCIWVSTKVAESLESLGVDLTLFPNLELVNLHGLGAVRSEYNELLSRFDLVFTIFGPNYFRKKNYINLVGFAQPWILDDSAYSLLSPFDRFKTKLKFFAQKLFFKTSDAFVVELEHVRDGLYTKGIAKPGSVHVAYNCISSLYLKPETWQPLESGITSPNFKVGFLGRDYTHKNTSILPDVKRILAERYGLNVDFFVTFNEQEWANKPEAFRSSIANVGSLAVTQCPSFYQALDAVIFPSLLECFSATPLEAMAMEKPLFASDRRFVKDICGDFALYFDPLDPENVADVIASYIQNQHGKDSERLALAREHAINFSSAKGRAERYLEIIRTELDKKHG